MSTAYLNKMTGVLVVMDKMGCVSKGSYVNKTGNGLGGKGRQLGQRHICSQPLMHGVKDGQVDRQISPMEIQPRLQRLPRLQGYQPKEVLAHEHLQSRRVLSQPHIKSAKQWLISGGVVAGVSAASVMGLSLLLGMPTCCVLRMLEERALQVAGTGWVGSGVLSAALGTFAVYGKMQSAQPWVKQVEPQAIEAIVGPWRGQNPPWWALQIDCLVHLIDRMPD